MRQFSGIKEDLEREKEALLKQEEERKKRIEELEKRLNRIASAKGNCDTLCKQLEKIKQILPPGEWLLSIDDEGNYSLNLKEFIKPAARMYTKPSGTVVRRPGPKGHTREDYIAAKLTGLTNTQIAIQFGVKLGTVSDELKKAVEAGQLDPSYIKPAG